MGFQGANLGGLGGVLGLTVSEYNPGVELLQESIFLPIGKGNRLHLLRIRKPDPDRGTEGAPVLMVHGAIANGRVFHSGSGKGLAPFLAREGFDVYVADLRGRGRSEPPVSAGSEFGQTEAIIEDLPAFVDAIRARRGDIPQVWIGYSWGGVLLGSFFARFPQYRGLCRGMVCLGTKRVVQARGWEPFFKVQLVWKRVLPFVAARAGYAPARELGIGSDNESLASLLQCVEWVKPGPWVDPGDGYDYAGAAKGAEFPPALFLAGGQDRALGNPRDVREWIREAGFKEYEFEVIPGLNHEGLVTDPEASRRHFRRIAQWLSRLPG